MGLAVVTFSGPTSYLGLFLAFSDLNISHYVLLSSSIHSYIQNTHNILTVLQSQLKAGLLFQNRMIHIYRHDPFSVDFSSLALSLANPLLSSNASQFQPVLKTSLFLHPTAIFVSICIADFVLWLYVLAFSCFNVFYQGVLIIHSNGFHYDILMHVYGIFDHIQFSLHYFVSFHP